MHRYITLWTNIRGTARDMIDHGTINIAVIYILIGGFGSSISGLMITQANNNVSVPILMITILIASAIFMIIMYGISTVCIYYIGKLLKGNGTYRDVFKGSSLVYIPFSFLIPVFIIGVLINAQGFFTLFTDTNSSITIIGSMVLIAISIFSIIVQIIAVSEAHQFSIGMSIITLIIPTFFFALFFLLVLFVMIAIFFTVAISM